MKELVVNKAFNMISKDKNYDSDKIAELRYGLEILYINLTKIIVIVSLAILLKITKQFFVLFISYSLLRTFGFGLHAKKSLTCWLITIPMFIVLPYVFSLLTFNNYLKIIILIACFTNFLLYAPADTSKRPLINNKKRNLFKTMILIITSVYGLYIFIGKDVIVVNILLLSLIIESCATNKYMYALAKEKFNNYKDYNRSVI